LNTLTDTGTLANATIAKVMKSMTTPLREAYKKEIIQKDPTRTLDPIDETGKEKGILTSKEFSDLLVWMRDNSPQHVLLATVLAAATGMRMGEIRALRSDDIQIVDEHDALIKIDESYSNLDRFKTPKAKKTRQTPCPLKVAQALLDLPHLDSLISQERCQLCSELFQLIRNTDCKVGAPMLFQGQVGHFKTGFLDGLIDALFDSRKRFFEIHAHLPLPLWAQSVLFSLLIRY